LIWHADLPNPIVHVKDPQINPGSPVQFENCRIRKTQFAEMVIPDRNGRQRGCLHVDPLSEAAAFLVQNCAKVNLRLGGKQGDCNPEFQFIQLVREGILRLFGTIMRV